MECLATHISAIWLAQCYNIDSKNSFTDVSAGTFSFLYIRYFVFSTVRTDVLRIAAISLLLVSIRMNAHMAISLFVSVGNDFKRGAFILRYRLLYVSEASPS